MLCSWFCSSRRGHIAWSLHHYCLAPSQRSMRPSKISKLPPAVVSEVVRCTGTTSGCCCIPRQGGKGWVRPSRPQFWGTPARRRCLWLLRTYPIQSNSLLLQALRGVLLFWKPAARATPSAVGIHPRAVSLGLGPLGSYYVVCTRKRSTGAATTFVSTAAFDPLITAGAAHAPLDNHRTRRQAHNHNENKEGRGRRIGQRDC